MVATILGATTSLYPTTSQSSSSQPGLPHAYPWLITEMVEQTVTYILPREKFWRFMCLIGLILGVMSSLYVRCVTCQKVKGQSQVMTSSLVRRT